MTKHIAIFNLSLFFRIVKYFWYQYEPESYMLSADPVDGVYISDHCPVVAFVETEE